MDVAHLKKMIADLPDDAFVVVAGNHGTCRTAEARVGLAKTPNRMGFVEFFDYPPEDCPVRTAVYISIARGGDQQQDR